MPGSGQRLVAITLCRRHMIRVTILACTHQTLAAVLCRVGTAREGVQPRLGGHGMARSRRHAEGRPRTVEACCGVLPASGTGKLRPLVSHAALRVSTYGCHTPCPLTLWMWHKGAVLLLWTGPRCRAGKGSTTAGVRWGRHWGSGWRAEVGLSQAALSSALPEGGVVGVALVVGVVPVAVAVGPVHGLVGALGWWRLAPPCHRGAVKWVLRHPPAAHAGRQPSRIPPLLVCVVSSLLLRLCLQAAVLLRVRRCDSLVAPRGGSPSWHRRALYLRAGGQVARLPLQSVSLTSCPVRSRGKHRTSHTKTFL